MTELVRFRVREKGTVVFEVEEPTAGIGEVSGVRRVREAKAAFEDHLAGVRDAAASALQIMREAGPDEVKIGFGVTFTLELGAVVARTAGQGHLDVEMTWRRTGPSAGPGAAPAAPATPAATPATATAPAAAAGGSAAAAP
jgi:Trypsin-co-occurring domain 1